MYCIVRCPFFNGRLSLKNIDKTAMVLGEKNFPGQSILDCLSIAAKHSKLTTRISSALFSSAFPSIRQNSMNGYSWLDVLSWSIFLLFLGSIVDSKRKIFRNTLVSVV